MTASVGIDGCGVGFGHRRLMMHDIIGADLKSADFGVFLTHWYRSDVKMPPISTGRYSHVCIWHVESNRERIKPSVRQSRAVQYATRACVDVSNERSASNKMKMARLISLATRLAHTSNVSFLDIKLKQHKTTWMHLKMYSHTSFYLPVKWS